MFRSNLRERRWPCAIIGSFALRSALGLTAVLLGCDSRSAKKNDCWYSSAGHVLGLVHEVPTRFGIAIVEFDEMSIDELRAFVTLDNAQRSRVMQVFVGKEPADDLPPVAGTTTTAGRTLRFTPRYPCRLAWSIACASTVRYLALT